MDWMHDELFDGRRLWVLTVVDTWSRVYPVMRVCRSATAMEVIDALEQARGQYGLPTTIRVDQGSEFTSKELDLWAHANGITLDFSHPGEPTDNAYAESFNANVRLIRLRELQNGSINHRSQAHFPQVSRQVDRGCSYRSLAIARK